MHTFKTHAKKSAFSLLLATVTAAAGLAQNAFISTTGPSNITLLNTTTNALAGTVGVPGQPSGMALTPDGAYIYVACQAANSVAVVSTSLYKVVATIPVEQTPLRLAMKPDGTQVYVVNQASNSVSVIDVASNTVVNTILVGSRPTDVAFSPDGSKAYVTNYYSYTVSVINTLTQSVAATWPTSSGPAAIEVGGNGTIYVGCQFSNAVNMFDPAGNSLGTISGFTYPSGIAVSSDGTRLYVANANAATMSVVDMSSKQIIATVPVASSPTNLKLSPDNSTVYVISKMMSSVNVISTATNAVTATVKAVGPYPFDMAFRPVNPPPVSSPPPACSYSLSQSSATFTASGGTGSVNVTAGTGCAWTANSNAGWARITSGASGSGGGTVNFTADANTSTAQVTGTLTVAGQTYTITEAGVPPSMKPSIVSVTPSSGSGLSQTFNAVFSDPNGASDVLSARILFGPTVNWVNNCEVYGSSNGALYLYNDAGTAFLGPLTAGSSGTLSNSQCTVNGTGSSITKNGNNFTLSVSLTFSGTYTGSKNVYLYVTGSAGSSGWTQGGTWAPASVGPPSITSIIPSSGSGLSQTFNATFSDGAGASDVSSARILFGATVSWVNNCEVYGTSNGVLYLYNDAGTAFLGPITAGSGGTLSNSQCTLNGTGSSITKSGNNFTLSVSLTFSGTYTGSKNVYLYATGSGGNVGWTQIGTWAPATLGPPPSIVSVTPSSGSGLSQTFSALLSDALGASDVSSARILFGATLNWVNNCEVYGFSNGALYLYNDAGTAWLGPITAGSSGTLSNSQCTLNGTGSSITKSGNNFTLSVSLTFSGTYTGSKNVYVYASGSGGNVGWIPVGTWTP